ncbi:antitoxin [Streptomyces sp. A3M-1-3]|uniref:antitoxin n=1 Tax=Streptomyces sp. A3M-1-3 TaxID=2962044 RepID=UPI0020B716AD|nr:antitoxin [Streptomyces sp. A3M-1-3]MCP3817956.1 antitoxin [Streptomyces sp. A3M-1-3]
MSMLDKLKGLLKGHEDTARQGVERTGDAIDERTHGKHSRHVDTAQQKMNDELGTREPPTPGDDRPPQG